MSGDWTPGPEIADPALRARIEDLLTGYVHAIDDGEVERWPGFFTADGFYQITTRESFEAGLPLGVMTCEGAGMLRDRVQALRKANIFEPHTYCHILGRPRIWQSDGGCRARTNLHVVRTMQDGRMETFAAGRYLDEIVLDGGSPKFRRRYVVLDSRRIDILLVLPL